MGGTVAEPIGTEGGTMWLSVPEAARHLGISERTVRKRIAANALSAEREGGGPWRVQVVTAEAASRSVPEAAPRGPMGGTTSGTNTEPIEAAYRVAGEAAVEVALVPLATMVEELRGLADQLAELARRNESLAMEVGTLRERQVGQAAQVATRDQTINTQAETIAELRRRAEEAEAERERLRELVRPDVIHLGPPTAAEAAPDAPGPTEGPAPGNPSPDTPAGFWARVRRVFTGED